MFDISRHHLHSKIQKVFFAARHIVAQGQNTVEPTRIMNRWGQIQTNTQLPQFIEEIF